VILTTGRLTRDRSHFPLLDRCSFNECTSLLNLTRGFFPRRPQNDRIGAVENTIYRLVAMDLVDSKSGCLNASERVCGELLILAEDRAVAETCASVGER
jgi:hypothetical protein